MPATTRHQENMSHTSVNTKRQAIEQPTAQPAHKRRFGDITNVRLRSVAAVYYVMDTVGHQQRGAGQREEVGGGAQAESTRRAHCPARGDAHARHAAAPYALIHQQGGCYSNPGYAVPCYGTQMLQ